MTTFADDRRPQPRTSNRTTLILLAFILLMATALMLFVGVDSTPTNLTTRRLFGLWRARHVGLALILFGLALALCFAARSGRSLWVFTVTVTSTLLMLVLLELGGRVGLVPWNALFRPSFGDLYPLGMRPIPNLDVTGHSRQDTASIWGLPTAPMPYHYVTDRHGYRNLVDRPSADIYLVGDSVLVAALVPMSDTVAARLETQLRRRVMQVALTDAAPQTMMQTFRDLRQPLEGKRVVQFIFEGNDLLDSAALQGRARVNVDQDDSFFVHVWHALTRLSQPTLGIAALRSCTIQNRRITFFWARESFAGVESQASVITDAMLRFASDVRLAGGQYAAVFVPTKWRVLGPLCTALSPDSDLHHTARHLSPLRDHMLAWSENTGIPLLDLTTPLVLAAQRGTIPWFELDTHWNGLGHSIVANAMAQWPALQ